MTITTTGTKTDTTTTTDMAWPLILASGSPRRRQLLTAEGFEFSVQKPQINETQRNGETALSYVRRLSQEKADAIATQLDNPAVVLAADTTVILAADTIGVETNGAVLGKPVDVTDARAMLKRLRGRAHQVCTAITIVKNGQLPQRYTEHICTTVHMRAYTDAEIETYIASGDPFDKAGSYAIQHAGFHPVERIETCYTNVMGLPLCVLQRALAQIGWPGTTPSPVCNCSQSPPISSSS